MIALIAQKVTHDWFNVFDIQSGRIVFSGTFSQIVNLKGKLCGKLFLLC